jgi:hypothetical protein
MASRAVIVLVGMMVAAIPGCREDEQGRAVLQKKGVYHGKSDSPLDAAQLEELRLRAQRQKY